MGLVRYMERSTDVLSDRSILIQLDEPAQGRGTPALTGAETHDETGSFPASD